MTALSRGEWLLLTAALSAMALWQGDSVSWTRFALAFTAIDAFGYLPGAVAFRRARGGRVAPVYHWLYNATHNFVTVALVAAAWTAARGGPEWAMLALPIHLAGDRGVFGNGFKPTAEPFERTPVRS